MGQGPRSYTDLPELPGRAPGVTESLTRTRSHVAIRQFRLTVLEGPDRGASYSSTGTATVIGTHPSSTWALTDKAMSRFHCEIALEPDGRLRLVDLGSRNGTRVNGVWIEQAWIEDQATLRLGRNVFRFELCTTTTPLAVTDQASFGDLVGASPEMRAVFAELERAAASDVTVLLSGETGTGKELAAEALHLHSRRRDRPFVVVDCGVLSPQLVQSELFGHVRGAFTGAVADRRGVFESAQGGTVFIDELGELPLELQPQLLRVLEAREVVRIGDHRPIPIDVRIVAATHRDLRRAVNQKAFRADLFYRLAVLPIRLPPLRERLSDLPTLVARLCTQLRVEEPHRSRMLAPAFLETLARHDWPGNVRELRNYVERACIVERPDFAPANEGVDEPVTGPAIDLDIPLKELKERWSSHLERAYLIALVERCDGNIARIAQHAGLSRMQVYRMLEKHGLRQPPP